MATKKTDKLRQKIKARVKAKVANLKQKIKDKVNGKKGGSCKGGACSYGGLLVAFGALCMAGCMETQPASRATTTTYGDIYITLDDRAKSNAVYIKIGDGSVASADSSGSTETQTATPTMDIRPDIDVKYNDAIGAASSASKSVIDSLAPAAKEAVLALLSSKGSGTIKVQKDDGTSTSVKCENGQCEYVPE